VEVTEVGVRLLRRYWAVLVTAIAVPVAIMAAIVTHSPATYTAHARLLAAPTVPQAQAQADAVISQVQAVATSQDVITTALREANVERNVDDVINAITVTGIGPSGIVDISYSDKSAGAAQQVVSALTDQVVQQIAGFRSGLPSSVADLTSLIALISDRQAAVQSAGGSAGKAAQALTQLISDLTNDRDKLQQLESTAAAPAIVDSAAVPTKADGRGLATKLSLAGLLGLVIGLLLIGAKETMRPGVSGAGRVARLLDVPTLGRVASDPTALADIGRRLRLASRQAGVSIVVLMRADRAAVSPELVERLQAATLRPDPVPSRVGIPIDGMDGSIAAGRMGVAATQTIPRLSVDGRPIPSEATANSPRQVCSFDELDPRAEDEQVGLVILAARSTRLTAIDSVRDLVAAAGWPLLGVLDDPRNRSGS
jgi:capsular polysaccharide biosynthesis protein